MAIDHFDTIVVGAGFGGIRTLYELRKLGLTAKCFELGSDVGGTWYWNRYPGARTDSEAWVYSLNFAPELKDEWKFEERYPGQESVQRNLSQVVGKPISQSHFYKCESLTLPRSLRFAEIHHFQHSRLERQLR